MDAPDVWSLRWQALSERIQVLLDEVNNAAVAQQPISRLNTIQALASCLQVFAAAQYSFFEDGFGNQTYNTLQLDPDYPQVYARRSVVNQAFEDVKIIERIFAQRQSTHYVPNLEEADKLALNALQPAMQCGLIANNTTVLSYFDKGGSIRIIPYAQVALIGLPFTARTTELDLLAIPHEVGHYVYRRGRIKDANGQVINTLRGAINEAIPATPQYRHHWMEEIFADYYGTQVAGALLALDFQDLQLEFSGKRFVMDDGDHPSPILRPHLYAKILGLSGSPWATVLDMLWIDRRTQFEAHKDPNDQGKFGSQKMTLAQAISPGIQLDTSKTLDRAIAVCDQQLGKHATAIDWTTASWWHNLKQINPPQEVILTTLQHMLDRAFVDACAQLPNEVPMDVAAELICAPEDLDTHVNGLLADWPAPFIEVLQDKEFTEDETPKLKSSWWVPNVLFAAGWNTFGNGQWTSGP